MQSSLKIFTMNKNYSSHAPILTNYAKATLWLGLITIVVIPPFSIANLLKGHYILSLICFSFMVLLVLQCVMIRNKRYSLAFTLLALVPSIILYIFFQIYTHGIVGVFWSFPASMVLFFILPLRYAIKSSICLLLVITPLIFVKVDLTLASSISLALALLAVISGYILSVIERQQQVLAHQLVENRMQIELVSRALQPSVIDINQKIKQIKPQKHINGDDTLSLIGNVIQKMNQEINRLFVTSDRDLN